MDDPAIARKTRSRLAGRAPTDSRVVLWFLIAAMLVVLGTIAYFFIRHEQPQARRSPQTELLRGQGSGAGALRFRT